MTLYIDADACPVKTEAERVATRLGVPMVLVCNGGIRPPVNPLVTLQVVDEAPTSPTAGSRRIAGRATWW